MTSFAARRERLRKQLTDEGLDALLVSHPVNVTYLSGFSGDSSSLVLTADHALLVSDARFTEQIAEECPDLETYIRTPTQPLLEALGVVLTRLHAMAVGVESGHMTLAEFERLRDLVKPADWKPGKDRVERLRQIKDEGELAEIRQAIRLAEKAFGMFRAMLRGEDTEKECADNLEHYVRRAGGKCTAFAPIVAVGERAALPHAPPTTRRLREAPLTLVDWGANGPFYKSDLTRVLLTHNYSPNSERVEKVAARVQEIYEVVLRAQQAAIAAIRPGVPGKDVDRAARQVIADAGYGEFFTHSIGHGLGLQVHETPFMRANTEEPLQAGMVVTVEPGIYLPGYAGVRIEDDVLVTPDGREVLSSLPKSLEWAIQEL